jgi:hypothetical protein
MRATPVHIDVDAFIKKLQADCAAVELPDDAPEFFRALLRNRQAQHGMVRALLEEENRGSPPSVRMGILSWYMAELLINTARDLGVSQEMVFSRFVLQMGEDMDTLNNQRAGDVVTSTKMAVQRGGHA